MRHRCEAELRLRAQELRAVAARDAKRSETKSQCSQSGNGEVPRPRMASSSWYAKLRKNYVILENYVGADSVCITTRNNTATTLTHATTHTQQHTRNNTTTIHAITQQPKHCNNTSQDASLLSSALVCTPWIHWIVTYVLQQRLGRCCASERHT
jgi:hypothetical protein